MGGAPVATSRSKVSETRSDTPAGLPDVSVYCTVHGTTADSTSAVELHMELRVDTRATRSASSDSAERAAALADTGMVSRSSVGHVAKVGKPMYTTQAFDTWTGTAAIEHPQSDAGSWREPEFSPGLRIDHLTTACTDSSTCGAAATAGRAAGDRRLPGRRDRPHRRPDREEAAAHPSSRREAACCDRRCDHDR